jgi:hypothetical protein
MPVWWGLVAAFLIVLKAALHQPPAAARTHDPRRPSGSPRGADTIFIRAR